MGKFKTTQGGGAHRIFEGLLHVCASDDKKNYKVKLMLLNEHTNRNNWRYLHVAEHANEANDIPLLYSVIGNKVGNAHDFEVVMDENGKEYASFIGAESEHPYGWLPSVIDGKPNAHMENIDGVDWLVATAYLPTFYNKEMIDELEKNNGQMPISIETLVTKSHMEGNVEVEEEYKIVGVTILGTTTTPAVAGANIRKLAFTDKTLKELKLRAASLANADSNKEPQTQNQNSQKGATKIMRVKDLQKANAFPNFTVLEVDGKNVALLSEDGAFYLSTAEKAGDELVLGAKAQVAPKAMFENGDVKMSVSLENIVSALSARINALSAELDEKVKACETVTKSLADMQQKERARRKEAVKAAIAKRLAEFNENREADEKLDEHACDGLIADAEADKYTDMVDANGDFCGDKNACKDVDSLCVDKQNQIQKDKAAASRANAQKYHAWNLYEGNDDAEASKGVLGALNRLRKTN